MEEEEIALGVRGHSDVWDRSSDGNMYDDKCDKRALKRQRLKCVIRGKREKALRLLALKAFGGTEDEEEKNTYQGDMIMYIITEKGYKSKPEVYKDEEIVMFEEESEYYWKVYMKDKREIEASRIEKTIVIFEGK
jgi:hypothetical protein